MWEIIFEGLFVFLPGKAQLALLGGFVLFVAVLVFLVTRA